MELGLEALPDMDPVSVLHLVPELTPSGRDRRLLDLLSRLDAQQFRIRVVAASATIPSETRATFAAAGVKAVARPLPDPGGRTWIQRAARHTRALAVLRDLIREESPRIVHTHGSWMNVHGVFAAHLAGVPHLMSHDHDAAPGGRRARLLQRWAARFPEVAFVDSPHLAAARRGFLGSGAERTLCLPLGIDLRHFQRATPWQRAAARRALGVADDAYVVGTVGHLSQRKHVLPLLDAMPALLVRRADARLVVCGDGPERAPLVARAHELGLGAHVIWAGWHPDPTHVYHALDVFTTLAAERGGACRTLAEAMACGLPSVASRTALHAEIGGEHALLVELRPRAVAQALIELGGSASRRHELGEEARRYAARHLDVDVAVRLLEATYAHSVARPPRPWGARVALPAR